MKKIFGTLFILSMLFAGTFAFAIHGGNHCFSGIDLIEGTPDSNGACVVSGSVDITTLPGVGAGFDSPAAPDIGAGFDSPASPNSQVSVPIPNPVRVTSFGALVALVISTAVTILMPFVVLAFIYSGFLFVKAQGKAEEIATAKSAIWWSIIGAFILLGASAFANIIGDTVENITG